MDEIKLKGRLCAYATPKPDGNLFWQNGIYEDENGSHYFFLVGGRLTAVLRASIVKIEFQPTQPMQPVASRGRV